MHEKLKVLQEKLEKLTLLLETSALINSTMEPKEVITLVLREAVRIMGATSGSLRMVDEGKGLLKLEVAIGEGWDSSKGVDLRIGEGVTGWVARHGRPLLVGDVKEDPRYVPLREDVRSELAVPLTIEDKIIGVLNVDSTLERAFDQTDLELLMALANQASRVIHNARLHAQVKRKALELESLFSVGQTIVSSLELNEVLERITRKAVELMDVKLCSLMLLDESGGELAIRAVHGASESYVRKPNLKVSDSLLGKVVRERRPLTVEDVRVHPEFKYSQLAQEEGLVSLLSVPMTIQDKVIGLLNVYTSRPHVFSKDEVELLTALASQSAIAIENASLYESVVAAEERIRQAERLLILGEMAAEIAHEVRNPLTVIRMLIHSLHEDFHSDDPRKKDTEVIEHKISQMENMVEQILEITRQREPQIQGVDVHHLLEETLTLVRHRLDHQKIKVAKTYQRAIPCILADPAQLERAFLNLVLNAAQAMPNGGTLTVQTGMADGGTGEGKRIWVALEDTGVGIPPHIKREIFKPFFSSRPDGIGLGLSIVNRIVKHHKGSIEVESSPGKGSRFVLHFPCEVEPDG